MQSGIQTSRFTPKLQRESRPVHAPHTPKYNFHMNAERTSLKKPSITRPKLHLFPPIQLVTPHLNILVRAKTLAQFLSLSYIAPQFMISDPDEKGQREIKNLS